MDKDSCLLELTRYAVLNPVLASMVEYPGSYVWSCYRSMAGDASAPGSEKGGKGAVVFNKEPMPTPVLQLDEITLTLVCIGEGFRQGLGQVAQSWRVKM